MTAASQRKYLREKAYIDSFRLQMDTVYDHHGSTVIHIYAHRVKSVNYFACHIFFMLSQHTNQ